MTFSDYRWQTCVCMLRKLLTFADNTASVACVIKYLALLQLMSAETWGVLFLQELWTYYLSLYTVSSYCCFSNERSTAYRKHCFAFTFWPGMLLTRADLVLLPLCWKDTGQIAQNFFFELTLSSEDLSAIYETVFLLFSKQILTARSCKRMENFWGI